MDFRPEEIAGQEMNEVHQRVVSNVLLSDQAATFSYDGRIIAVMGFVVLWKGVIEAWIVPTAHVYTASIAFPKIVKRYIDAIAKSYECRRMQTGSYDDDFHKRWMEFLGFEFEGVKKKFTPDGRDYVNYVRFF